jgi:hypothetical protein
LLASCLEISVISEFLVVLSGACNSFISIIAKSPLVDFWCFKKQQFSNLIYYLTVSVLYIIKVVKMKLKWHLCQEKCIFMIVSLPKSAKNIKKESDRIIKFLKLKLKAIAVG